jgi:hypothetical protein
MEAGSSKSRGMKTAVKEPYGVDDFKSNEYSNKVTQYSVFKKFTK